MWILSFLPDSFLFWFINIVLLVGLIATVGSFFLRYLPGLFPYATPIKITGITLLVLGVWFRGGYDVEMSWRAKASELQSKIDVAEKESKEANKALEANLTESRSVIKDKVNETKKVIESNRKNIDAECKLNDTAWVLYNRALENKLSRSSVTVNGASTGSKASK